MKFCFFFFLSSVFLCACATTQSTNSTSSNVESAQLSVLAGEQVYVEIAIKII